jgi:hypothetical protein
MLRNDYVAHLVRPEVPAANVASLAGLHDVDQVSAMRRALGV